jgi:hypothetical protein
VKTKKEKKKDREHKNLDGKKKKKAMIHHQNPQLCTSIFPRKIG